MADLECMVSTPEGPVFDGKTRSVVVPAVDGELGVLRGHAPLIAALGYGQLRIEAEGGKKAKFFLHGGFVQVLHNRVTVLATIADALETMTLEEATRLLDEVLESPPAAGASIPEREEYDDRLRAAQARVQMLK